MTLIYFQMKFNKQIMLFFHDRKLDLNDFSAQLLRMIVSFDLFFRSVANFELQKIFNCLYDSIRFFSFFIMKNMLIQRFKNIQQSLLKIFFQNVKTFLIMNCGSSFNRQNYFEINAYFIDEIGNYHEVFIAFQHVARSHTSEHLKKMIGNVLNRYNLKRRILNTIFDNADNNNKMHDELMKFFLKKIAFEKFFHSHAPEKIFCIVHVIQFAFQVLLNKLRFNSINVDFKNSGNETKDKKKFQKSQTLNISFILIKVY